MNSIEGMYLAGFHDLNHLREMIQSHIRPAIDPMNHRVLQGSRSEDDLNESAHCSSIRIAIIFGRNSHNVVIIHEEYCLTSPQTLG
jgi:hypothetical protein